MDPREKSNYEASQKGRTPKPIDLHAYAKFVKAHSDGIFQFLTADVIRDPIQTRKSTDCLIKIVGCRSIPVFHIQNSLDVLKELVAEDHDVIAIRCSVLVGRKE